MAGNSEITEFLSAYVCGDVRPEERAAIEQLLAANSDFKAQAEELRRLIATLKQGNLEVRPALLSALKERVEASIAERVAKAQTEALISASLSNDVDAREKAILEKHLQQHPRARQQSEALKSFSTFLKSNDRALSAGMSKKLIERLNAKLPAAAKLGTPTSAAMTAVSGESQRATVASVRVFAAPENPWPRRFAYGAAMAAMVALAFGAVRYFGAAPAGNTEIVKSNGNERKDDVVMPGVVKNSGQPTLPVGPAPRITENDPKPQNAPQPPREIPVPGPQAPEVVGNDRKPRNVPVETPNASPDPKPGTKIADRPKETPANPAVERKPDEKVTDNNSAPRPAPQPRLPDNFVGDGVAQTNNGGGGLPFTQPQTQTPNAVKQATADENNTIAPVAGVAVVGAIRGTAQAMKPNGETVTLSQTAQIASGSDIVTDESRIALVLPGGARLYVNKKTRLTLLLEGSNANVLLERGEISYRANGAGTLALTAENVDVTRAKAVDSKIENNALVVQVLEQNALVSAKGKRLQVQSGSKAVAALNGAEAPRRESFSGKPDSWTQDLVLPGEGAANDTKIITNENPDNRTTRSRRGK